MFRLWYLAFTGVVAQPLTVHPHESPWSMLGSSCRSRRARHRRLGLAIDQASGNFLSAVTGSTIDPATAVRRKTLDLALSGVAVAAALLGWLVAYLFYKQKPSRPAAIAAAIPSGYKLLANKYHVDEIYNSTVVRPLMVTSTYASSAKSSTR